MEKPSHLKFVLRSFTDDEITELLEAGGNFREMKVAWRDSLLQHMRSGLWDCGNGDCLAMTEDGSLVNGQHRLSAAQIFQRETGEKVWFWVATGVRSVCVRTMDQGLNRTLTSLLKKDGIPHASECAAIALSDHRMMGNRSGTIAACFQSGSKDSSRVSLPHAYESWKRSSAKIQEWAAIDAKVKAAGLPRSSLLACCGFQLSKQADMDAKLFFSLLCGGDGLAKGDPLLLLRERLLEDRRSPHAKMPQATIAALLVKAWVAWRRGTPIGQLKYMSVGPKAEKFPSHIVD